MTFNVTGQKRLMKKISKIKNAPVVFDDVYKKIVAQALSSYSRGTNRDTGDTARSWKVKKEGMSNYIVFNDKRTDADHSGKRYLIAQIINDGRKTVYPVRAKKLYIPLTSKGKTKDQGAKLGVDYVLVGKSRAVKGTKFIDKVNKKYVKKLSTALVQKVRLIHSRGTV